MAIILSFALPINTGQPMRLAGIFVVLALIGIATAQSIVGGAPESEAENAKLALAASDICTVEVATVPVIVTQAREIVTTPAHKRLTVTPARFGTRTETVEIVPEHREGATFFAEPRRVIISEPTRRLRAMDAVFDSDDSVEDRTVIRPYVEDGKLVEQTDSLPAIPDSRMVRKKASIQAVRINAGLKMIDTKILDRDGEGEPVPAETIEIEVRTVEAQPSVATEDIPAVIEIVEIEIVETPSRRVEAEAICAIASRNPMIRRVQDALAAKGITTGESGVWSPVTIDAMAAMQAEETGLVSPFLLLETLRAWVPDVELPVS